MLRVGKRRTIKMVGKEDFESSISTCGSGRTRRTSAYSSFRSDSRLCWCAEHRNLTIRTEERISK